MPRPEKTVAACVATDLVVMSEVRLKLSVFCYWDFGLSKETPQNNKTLFVPSLVCKKSFLSWGLVVLASPSVILSIIKKAGRVSLKGYLCLGRGMNVFSRLVMSSGERSANANCRVKCHLSWLCMRMIDVAGINPGGTKGNHLVQVCILAF